MNKLKKKIVATRRITSFDIQILKHLINIQNKKSLRKYILAFSFEFDNLHSYYRKIKQTNKLKEK